MRSRGNEATSVPFFLCEETLRTGSISGWGVRNLDLDQRCSVSKYLSASIAAMHPLPAAVTAWR